MDLEQHFNIKLQLPKKYQETHEMLKSVYGDNVMILKTVYKWYKRFESRNVSAEDEQRSGHPFDFKKQTKTCKK